MAERCPCASTNNGRFRMFRPGGIDVKTIRFDRHLDGVIAETAEFSVKIISDPSLAACDRLDVHQLPRQRNCIHAGENSKWAFETLGLHAEHPGWHCVI